MGGRDSLSLEGRIAAKYIAGFFHRYQLKPVGDGGTYFQNFPMVEAAHRPRPPRICARRVSAAAAGGGTSSRDYAFGPDFTMARQGGADVDVDRAAGVRRLRHLGARIRLQRLRGRRRRRQSGDGAERTSRRRAIRKAASWAGATPSTPTTSWKPEVIATAGRGGDPHRPGGHARIVRRGRRAVRPTARFAPTVPPTR